MRPLATLILACTSLVFGVAPFVEAQQQHKTANQQHQNNNSYAPMNFPNNAMHFPNNNINFPNPALNFPSNNITFPNQNITFPNQNLTFPNQAFHFPNSAFNFPNYNTNFNNGMIDYSSYGNGNYSNASNHSRSKGAKSPSAHPLDIPNTAPMMGFGVGFGAAYAAAPHHYRGTTHHYRTPRQSTAYRTNGQNYGSTLTPAQRHYNKFVNDLDSLPPQFQVLDTHRNILNTDMQGLVEGSDHPTATAVQQLSHNLAGAMTRRKSQVINTAMLANDIRYVMNSGHLPKAEVDRAISQTQNVLKEGGFSPADVRLIVADMHAVAGQVRAKQTAQASK